MTATAEQRVFDYLETHPDRTEKQIAEALGLTPKQVSNAITGLRQEGCVPLIPRTHRLVDGAIRPKDGRGGYRVRSSGLSVPRGIDSE